MPTPTMIRAVLLVSIGVKVVCLIALIVYWKQLPPAFCVFAAVLLIIIIAVQGRLLWNQRR